MVVSVSELKEHLRIQHDEEDTYIAALLAQAQAAASDFCRVNFDQETTTDSDGNTVAYVVPEPVRLAIMLMASFYYENRDIPDMTTYKAMRMAFDSLLYPHRDISQMF